MISLAKFAMFVLLVEPTQSQKLLITAYHCVVLPFTPSQVLALNFLYRRLDFKGAHPCARHTFDVSFRSDKGSSSSPKHIRFLVWNFFVSLSTLRRRLRVGPFIFPELPSQRLLGRKLSKRRRGVGGRDSGSTS